VKKISSIKGQWNIDFEHNGKVTTNTFDYLTICTGTNQKPKEIRNSMINIRGVQICWLVVMVSWDEVSWPSTD
jgi:hypothetical protein